MSSATAICVESLSHHWVGAHALPGWSILLFSAGSVPCKFRMAAVLAQAGLEGDPILKVIPGHMRHATGIRQAVLLYRG